MAAPASALSSTAQNAERRPSRSSHPFLGVKIPFERKCTPNPVTTGTKLLMNTSESFYSWSIIIKANCSRLYIVLRPRKLSSFRRNCLVSSRTTFICCSLLTSRFRSSSRKEMLRPTTSTRVSYFVEVRDADLRLFRPLGHFSQAFTLPFKISRNMLTTTHDPNGKFTIVVPKPSSSSASESLRS